MPNQVKKTKSEKHIFVEGKQTIVVLRGRRVLHGHHGRPLLELVQGDD